jgi:hypothetical protein
MRITIHTISGKYNIDIWEGYTLNDLKEKLNEMSKRDVNIIFYRKCLDSTWEEFDDEILHDGDVLRAAEDVVVR